MPTSKNTGMATRKPTRGEGHGHPPGAELGGEVRREGLHPAGDLDHPAQDGAEGDQEGDLAHGSPHPVGHHGEDVLERDLGGHGHQDADGQQRHEGLDLEADDHEQKQGDAGGGDGQQQRSSQLHGRLDDGRVGRAHHQGIEQGGHEEVSPLTGKSSDESTAGKVADHAGRGPATAEGGPPSSGVAVAG